MRSILTLLLTTAFATGCAGVGEGESIGPRGGVLVSDDGRLSVEIRRDALEDELEIAVASTACDGGSDLACYDFEPWGVMLALPAPVVFDYQAAADTAAVPPTQLQLMLDGAEGWNPMPDANIDAAEGVVWASAMYLTTVKVVAP